MEQLRTLAEGEDGLFADFEYHIATSGRSVKDETARLEQWFRDMPQLKLRDWRNHERLAESLSYLRVSRKELYEVFAAMLVLERYTREEQPEGEDFAAIKTYVGRAKPLLAADWTEQAYLELWDEVLALPGVKTMADKKGRQKNTTFNRNLIANILHTMANGGVFAAGTTNQAMAETLEGTKDHSVREAVGNAPKDRVIKSSIEKLIAAKKEALDGKR